MPEGYSKKKYEELQMQIQALLTCALNIGYCVAYKLGCFTAEDDYPVIIEYETL